MEEGQSIRNATLPERSKVIFEEVVLLTYNTFA
jgi:hypothetical protein